MVLEFKEYTKKIKRDTILELDFRVATGEILTIVNNSSSSLELLKDSFRQRTKFKNSKSPTNSSSIAFILNRDNAFFRFFNNDKSL